MKIELDFLQDTIVAQATTIGKSALAILRVSGPQAFAIVEKVFQSSQKITQQKTHTIVLGHIVDPLYQEKVDQVLLLLFRAPHSFTGEDSIEITCHGGVVIPNRILKILLDAGCRLAFPGEFSKRAYLNGKIDLTQAEAIHDMITMPTSVGASLAFSNLKKKLSLSLSSIKENLISLLALLEASIDYPEEEIPPFTEKEIEKLEKVIGEIEKIIQQGEKARKTAKGFRIALIGRPNVGKSSLLNYLVGEEKAIVSAIPGTTRDIIEVELFLKNMPIILIDTAGIRETYENEIEGYGILKAKMQIETADMILFLVDGTQGITEEDKAVINQLPQEKTRIIFSKSDLVSDKEKEKIWISVKTGEGIEKLMEIITEYFKIYDVYETSYYVNQRQDAILRKMLFSLKKALDLSKEAGKEELVAFEIRLALETLGEITGDNIQEQVLESIFTHFCVGK